jgi:hypothetical protein
VCVREDGGCNLSNLYCKAICNCPTEYMLIKIHMLVFKRQLAPLAEILSYRSCLQTACR